MNRSARIDSKLLLDVGEVNTDPADMVSQARHFYAERQDPARNMARFYALSIERTLFGEICVIRRWGRIGSHGRTKAMCFADADAAAAHFSQIERQKARRGYRQRQITAKSLSEDFSARPTDN